MSDMRFPATILTGFPGSGADRSPTQHHYRVVDGAHYHHGIDDGFATFSLERRGEPEATLSALDIRSVEDGVAPNLFSEADYGRFIAALHRFDSMERF